MAALRTLTSKGNMRNQQTLERTFSTPGVRRLAGAVRKSLRLLRRLPVLGLSISAVLSCGIPSARAFDFVPLGEGALPSGDLVQNFQFTIGLGKSVPWHFHPGRIFGVIVSGTLTEDEGCGQTMHEIKAGSAFAETPGRVHRVFNFGAEPVVIIFTFSVPPCYPNYSGTIFVDAPRCEGRSGKSHLEKIPPCTLEAVNPGEPKPGTLRAVGSIPSAIPLFVEQKRVFQAPFCADLDSFPALNSAFPRASVSEAGHSRPVADDQSHDSKHQTFSLSLKEPAAPPRAFPVGRALNPGNKLKPISGSGRNGKEQDT